MWLMYEYAEKLCSHYPRYRRVPGPVFKLNSRCPICGDSATNEFKARFWVYEKKGTLWCHCFNCGLHENFNKYLKEQDEQLYREYLLERRKFNPSKHSEPEQKFTKTIKEIPSIQLNYCTRCDKLPVDHPIRKYFFNRAIPSEMHKNFFYTSEWQKLCCSVKPGTYKEPRKEHRIVIPIVKNGVIEAFQGRAIKDDPRKYITIKSHENATKIYGLDSVPEQGPVYITEGPIDCMFLDGISITGGSIALSEVPYKDRRIWVLDNEPRAPETRKRMESLIRAGETVCFWTDCKYQHKDINDMVKAGATKEYLKDYINKHSFSGLKAKLEMKRFK